MTTYALQVTTYWGAGILDVVSTLTSMGQADVLVPTGAELELPLDRGQQGPRPALVVLVEPGERLVYRVGALKVVSEFVRREASIARRVVNWRLRRLFALSMTLHGTLLATFLTTPTPDVRLQLSLRCHPFAHCFTGMRLRRGRARSRSPSRPHLPQQDRYGVARLGAPDLPPDPKAWQKRKRWDAEIVRRSTHALFHAPEGPATPEMSHGKTAGGLGTRGRCRYDDVRLHWPQIRWLGTVTRGELSTDQIDQVLLENIARFKYCYEKRLLVVPYLSGRLPVTFGIRPDGLVSWVGIGISTMENAGVRNCSIEVLKTLRFPRSRADAGTAAEYRFTFLPH